MINGREKCPVSEYCGGCQYRDVGYEQQLSLKQESVERLLSSFHHVEKIIGCSAPFHYRNKMQVSFGIDERKNVICGYYAPDSHMIVPVDSCMICDEGINGILSYVRKIMLKYHVPVYDERSGKGCLRHLQIRSSGNGEYMLSIVTGSVNLPKQDLLMKDIRKCDPEITTVIHNVNRSRGSQILGDRSTVLYGKGYITDHLCGLDFRISPSSFYQVNKTQTEVLYNEVIKAAGLNGTETVIDAYCGTGTIGLAACGHAKEVIGIESNGEAVKDAKINCRINQITNASFTCGDAGRYMEQMSKDGKHADVVIMDPPRSGSDRRFLSSLMRMRPERIVYVSCNPLTLKRDLNELVKQYDVEKIQPVDMFPQTKHVETVCCLYHQKKDFISVPYEPKDADNLKR